MTQTVKVGDTLSRKLRDEVSADLRGYVTVQVKNKKTGDIEHQENHNLIVYGGREWLLKRIFGSVLPNNEFATNSGIRWVGFGCGGGEAGNPLQAGTTLGHDADLYEPCRIRFEDDSVTSESNGVYASRILPNGSVVPGYYKKISNVTIKEDHANPYIENNIRKYPRIIAEIRVELSSDDCNGENYTENGNLVAYQDINEVGLFISDLKSADPGKDDKYDEKFIDIIAGNIQDEHVYTNKTYWSSDVTQLLTKSGNDWIVDKIVENAYMLQYKVANGTWTYVTENRSSVNIENNSTFKVTRGSNNKLTFKINDTAVTIGDWGEKVVEGDVDFRIISVGKYLLEYKNAIVHNPDNQDVICEIQYKNYSTDAWKVLDTHTFHPGDATEDKIYRFSVPCNSKDHSDINIITNFRVRQTTNSYSEIHILDTELDATSYDVKCYVSEEDIKKVKVNNAVYTEVDTESTNYIPMSAPLGITEVYDPEVEDPETAREHRPYFVIERQGSETHSYSGDGLKAWTYAHASEAPYTMFSRVTLSSIRKTVDREIVLLWKIYC